MNILLKHIEYPGSTELKGYCESGGYKALSKALDMKPADIVNEVRRSGLRGRGGAGFPTGMKWTIASMDPKKPKYIICNADEGEPGTFKDRPILEKNPHLLIEGMAVSAYAIQAEYGYIYLRGEYPQAKEIVEKAIKDAYSAGYLGDNILGKGFKFHLFVYFGAGAYICGEETAMIESLEGKRGQPRIKPPFPVNEGFLAKPTVINNVETFANIPHIVEIGADAYLKIGSPESPGPKLFSVSGSVNKPGVYELPMGTTLREIIYGHCGGIKNGKELKAVIPGGVSTPIMTADKIDCPMDFVSLPRYGSMLGSGGIIVFDETADLLKVCLRIMEFFDHESCGKCTPCREGVGWLVAVLRRMSTGSGNPGDIELLTEISKNILGKCFCALGDGAAMVVQGFLNNFRSEMEAGIGGQQ
ncbi:MAG: NADH oxidoreductase (quinone) subunit F [Nitrospirae bacterium]|nr:MAG: NADH oxidoreductase (quinone) subunit F [Nitrospirota bacterium]